MKIDCKSTTLNVSIDNKLYPCCWLLTQGHDSPYLRELEKNDPEWNDLTKKDIKVILKHDAFVNYYNNKGWTSNDCDPICIEECQVDE